MMLAIGIILPFATAHGFGIPGNVLLPMHIPVFLTGLLCGPVLGAVSGLLLPALNSLLTGMPALFPMLPMMTAELFTYGLVSGILYHKTPLSRFRWGVYAALVLSMLAGRVSYGLAFNLLLLLGNDLGKLSVIGAVITGLPGIIIQILLRPALVITLGYASRPERPSALRSAINLIKEGTASCVAIKDGVIVATEEARGIGPVLKLYDKGALSGCAVVDKIIGKAAASILILGGCVSCYGMTVSVAAKELLESHGISVGSSTLTDRIINRSGDGTCPMELAVKDCDTPEAALSAVRQKLSELRSSSAE